MAMDGWCRRAMTCGCLVSHARMVIGNHVEPRYHPRAVAGRLTRRCPTVASQFERCP